MYNSVVRIGSNDIKEATMDKAEMLIFRNIRECTTQQCYSEISEYNQHIEKSLFKTFPITNFCY